MAQNATGCIVAIDDKLCNDSS